MPHLALRRALDGALATLTTALVAALLVTVSQAPTARAAETTGSAPGLGAQWHATWSDQTDADRARELDTLVANGVQWVRIDVGWAMLQPRAGSNDTGWAVPFVQKQIEAAKARGLKVLVTFWRTPDWANGGKGPLTAPTDPSTYGAALAHFVSLWKGKVDGWEIWNEPNADDFLVGADPVQYTKLLKAGYTAAHAADPDVNIVFGGTMYVDTDWIRRTYDAGAKGYFDTMAVHPYMGPADAAPEKADDGNVWTMMHTDTLVDLMANRGDSAKPIWFTEFGWSVHANTSSTEPWNRGVSEATQADFFRRAVQLTASRWPQVDTMIWYNSRDKNTGRAQQDGYGLMKRDFTPRAVLPLFGVLRAAGGVVDGVGGVVDGVGGLPTTLPTLPTTDPRPIPAMRRQTLVQSGATWKYNESGRKVRGWKTMRFNPRHWRSGTAVLGYGDDGITSHVRSSRMTYAFRKTIYLGKPHLTRSFWLQVQRDDGIAVYVNGRRVWVDNLPSRFGFATPARTTIVDDEAERTWLSRSFSSRLLRKGRNVIAVEVHNADRSSSDARFNLKMFRTVRLG